MLRPFLFALLACAIAVIGEALLAGRDGTRFMESLRQPPYFPPLWAWSLIGLAYYAICFLTLFRLTRRSPVDRLPVILLLALMAANTVWNYVFFRLQDLALSFWYSIIYVPLAVALLATLLRRDRVSGLAFAAYVLYLPYALWLFHRTWKLNT